MLVRIQRRDDLTSAEPGFDIHDTSLPDTKLDIPLGRLVPRTPSKFEVQLGPNGVLRSVIREVARRKAFEQAIVLDNVHVVDRGAPRDIHFDPAIRRGGHDRAHWGRR